MVAVQGGAAALLVADLQAGLDLALVVVDVIPRLQQGSGTG
jgi:hypothetical protein